ncbi:hypothetical protein GTN30_02680 [Macrococcoides canis]|uniref:Uncharacterized protein n=1 Tax=Macrococcoides canis TaxID=1855823 RepID=A0AAE7BZ75_9STAP|nr:hypothetical protein [Macrococcus canis]QIH77561.1 hypothetical protein GTN30_02680 [Macrococcus canis]
MIPTYDKAKEQHDLLDFETAHNIYSKMITGINLSDSEFKEYWDDFITGCIEYSNFRSLWLTLSREEKNNSDFDKRRTDIHNGLITKLNVVKRYLDNEGKNTNWFDEITQERKRIGDFANYIAYIYAVNSRD